MSKLNALTNHADGVRNRHAPAAVDSSLRQTVTSSQTAMWLPGQKAFTSHLLTVARSKPDWLAKIPTQTWPSFKFGHHSWYRPSSVILRSYRSGNWSLPSATLMGSSQPLPQAWLVLLGAQCALRQDA